MWQYKKGSVIRESQKMLPELLVMLFFSDDQLNSKHQRGHGQYLSNSHEDVFLRTFLLLIYFNCIVIISKNTLLKAITQGPGKLTTAPPPAPSSLRSYATHSKPATAALSISSDRSSHPPLLGFTFPRCPLGSSCTSLWAL